MILERFCVQNLFNMFNYDILFVDEYVKLLTGPNGYGKTTILTIIHNLIGGNFVDFYYLPFDEVKLYMVGEVEITIVQSKNDTDNVEIVDREIANGRKVTFYYKKQNQVIAQFSLDGDIIEKMRRKLRFSRDLPIEQRHVISDAMMMEYLHLHNWVYREVYDGDMEFGRFVMLLQTIGVFFEPANRLLLRDGNGKMEKTIRNISKALNNELEKIRIEYLKRVSEYRNSLIDKLLSGDVMYDKFAYQEKIVELQEEVSLLHEWGLIPFGDFKEYNETKQSVMSVYLEEILNTISVYTPIFKKIRSFERMLRSKTFVNKEICYSSEYGLQIRLLDGSLLDCEKLSSGEQNEIIMAFHLIFGIQPNMLVLVDEPENSLHVEWQSQYIKDLEEMCEANNLQAIVATHSPQIIGERWRLCYDLYEQQIGSQENEFN